MGSPQRVIVTGAAQGIGRAVALRLAAPGVRLAVGLPDLHPGKFAPIGAGGEDASPFAPRQLEFDTSDYVQMELLGLDAHEDE